MTVLVTGGTGFVGSRLKLVKPDWIYVSSNMYDLTSAKECRYMFRDIRPEAVVHLAGRVGGIFDNVSKQAEYFYINTMINTNLIHCAYKSGVRRLLASLSTCAFPDKVEEYPFTEEDIFKGPPVKTNFAYGFTKRNLHVQALSYREQYGVDYSCFCPSNVYGIGDNFNHKTSHFVPSLIRKLTEAKNGDIINMWGTGKPLRQQLYVDDLCQIIPELLENHTSELPLIVAPEENLSIRQMCEMLREQTGKDVKFKFNGNFEGQHRKDGTNRRLLELIYGFNFTPFAEGVLKTYRWYNEK